MVLYHRVWYLMGRRYLRCFASTWHNQNYHRNILIDIFLYFVCVDILGVLRIYEYFLNVLSAIVA